MQVSRQVPFAVNEQILVSSESGQRNFDDRFAVHGRCKILTKAGAVMDVCLFIKGRRAAVSGDKSVNFQYGSMTVESLGPDAGMHREAEHGLCN